jgi:hypothetical protein
MNGKLIVSGVLAAVLLGSTGTAQTQEPSMPEASSMFTCI